MTTGNISQYETKIIIRPIVRNDFPAIIALQLQCFPGMMPCKMEQLENHIREYPEGQICDEIDDQIIGSCASLIVNFNHYLEQHTYSEITRRGYITNHNPNGQNVY